MENQEELDLRSEGLANLLHRRECPVGYHCLALDCIECLKKYIDQESENNGRK